MLLPSMYITEYTRRVIRSFAVVFSVFTMIGCMTLPEIENLHHHRIFAQSDSKFAAVDNIEIHFKRYGEGDDSLVLLHGFLSHLHSWDCMVEHFPQTYSIYAYDRLAFGISQRPLYDTEGNPFTARNSPYTQEQSLERFKKLLAVWNIEQAVLVGNSKGGNLAVQAALAYPDQISALVLIAPAIYQSGPPGIVKFFIRTGLFDRIGIHYIRKLQDNYETAFNDLWFEPQRMEEDLKAWYLQPFEIEGWDYALLEYTKRNANQKIINRLKELDIPVLIIHGREDSIIPVKQSKTLAKNIAGSKLEIMEYTGHTPQEERPRETAHMILEFLKETNMVR